MSSQYPPPPPSPGPSFVRAFVDAIGEDAARNVATELRGFLEDLAPTPAGRALRGAVQTIRQAQAEGRKLSQDDVARWLASVAKGEEK